MLSIVQDVRYAIRQLAKSPGFAIVSVLTLALGIGANIAVFSVTNAVLLNPSGIPHSANLVALRARYTAMPDLQSIPFSAPDFGDVAEGKNTFASSGLMDDTTFNFSRDNIDTVLAHQYWPGQDPIGQQIATDDRDKGPWITIVGVTAHARASSLESDTNEGFYYLPLAQVPSPMASVVVRSSRAADNLNPDLAAAVHANDSSIALYDVKSLEQRVNESLIGRRFVVILLTTFAGLALLLAALGLYGVISCSVRLRTRELGVRMALGAQRGRALGMVLLQGMRLAVIGLASGFLAAIVLGRVFSGLLFKVSVIDFLPWLSAIAVLIATVLLASYLPARRAASIEPMKALRTE